MNAARTMISKGADCTSARSRRELDRDRQAATVPARVPQIGPNNSSPALTDLKDNGYFFRTMPSDTLQAPILARLIKEEMGGGKTISLAGRNDAFGTGLLPILKTALERVGMKTQGPLLYDPTAASYNSEADDIVKGNPDTRHPPSRRTTPRSARRSCARPVQRAEALRRRRLAGHHPVVHPDCLARGGAGTVAGSPTGTKAARSSTGSSRPGPGRRTARRWTRTTSTGR